VAHPSFTAGNFGVSRAYYPYPSLNIPNADLFLPYCFSLNSAGMFLEMGQEGRNPLKILDINIKTSGQGDADDTILQY